MKKKLSESKIRDESQVPQSKLIETQEERKETLERIKHFKTTMRRLELFGPPQFSLFAEGRIQPAETTLNHCISVMETFGTDDYKFGERVLNQIVTILNPKLDRPDLLNAAMTFLHAMKPVDEMECLLLAQMVGVQDLAMKFMGRAANPEHDVEIVNANVNRAAKLMRTFTAQLEALNRNRGKGQQKVTVEHVTVNSGGQAIVGHVTGGGVHEKK